MFFPQQVVNGFHRVECNGGHFKKKGNPVGHGSIPEPRVLQRLEFLSIFGFQGDKDRIRVHIFPQIKRFAPPVPNSAHQVHGIEMGGAGQDSPLFLVIRVNLGRFNNLE